MKKINLIISAIVFAIGTILILVFGGWQLFLGILLFMWGNNITMKYKAL